MGTGIVETKQSKKTQTNNNNFQWLWHTHPLNPRELLTSHSTTSREPGPESQGERPGGRGAVSGFGPANPGAQVGSGRGKAALVPLTCGEVERGGLPARRVAAVHLLGRHQPLNSLHVPVAASLEQLAGGRLHCLGRRARAGRAPAGAAAARHYSGRRRRRQQQRQQRQQEPRPREQEGEAPRRRRAQGPGLSAPCCHRARRSPMAAPPRIPRSASRPPTAPPRRRHREPAARAQKRRGGGNWQGPSRQLRWALGAHVTSRRACAVVVGRPARFWPAGRAEGFVGNVRRAPLAAGGVGASSHRHLCGGFCWSWMFCLMSLLKNGFLNLNFLIAQKRTFERFPPILDVILDFLLWTFSMFSAPTTPLSWRFLPATVSSLPRNCRFVFCEPLLRNEWVAWWEVWMSCPKIMWRKLGKHWKFVPLLNNWEVWLTWITLSIVNSLGLKGPSRVYILCWLGWSVDILGIHIADKV